jgi:hypothetical protein
MIRHFAIVAMALALIFVTPGSNAAFIVFMTSLSGPNESPPNASPGTGTATVDLDTVGNTLHVSVSFSGLQGTTTASHIHSATASPGTGTAIVATTTPTFPGFPLGVTSGVYDNTLDLTLLTSYNPAFVTANGGTAASAEAALIAGMLAGEAYLNIHSTVVPGGEIRGFLQIVPEPGSVILLSTGVLGVLAYGWCRGHRHRAAGPDFHLRAGR